MAERKKGISHDTAAQLIGIAPSELEALVRDVYRRDYMSFGFGAWKAPK